jgi:hypothetical protein
VHQDNAGQENTADKTFTQAEIDKIVGERLARERSKYSDYEDVKGILEELNAYGYQGGAKEVREAIKSQREAVQKQQELETLQDEAKEKGATPELLAEIKQLKAEIADMKKEREDKKKEEEKKQQEKEAFNNQVKEFEEKYPNIDLDKLNKDADFLEFLEASNPNLTLSQVYAKFEKFVGGAESKAIAKIQSNVERSTSSGRNKGDANGGTYGLTPRQQDLARQNGMTNKEYAELLSNIKK